MVEKNQNNQDSSSSSFKEQIMRSLNNSETGTGSTSSENISQNSIEEHTQLDNFSNQNKSFNEEKRESNSIDPNEELSRKTKNNSTKTKRPRTRQNAKVRKKEESIVNKIVIMVATVLVLLVFIFGFTFYNYVNEGLQPLDINDKKLVQVSIPQGSSSKEIASILENSKVIKSGMVFSYYVKFNNVSDFQSGYYQLAPNMTLDDISKILQEGGTAEPTELADGKVTIPEGYDIDKIGDAIEENTDFTKQEFLDLMKDEEFFDQMKEKYPNLLSSAAEAQGVRYRLEGYLFPATYDYYEENSLSILVEEMIKKENTVLEAYIPTINAKNLTVQQVLTLASLVEKEGVKEEDRKKIAQVFFNRIAQEMPLQSDIAILYSLGEHKELVTYKDLEVDSPYNLYQHAGYGPGPMNSPSEEAIEAVLNPIDNNYIYFVADISTGNVYFAETYEEHQVYVDQYVNKDQEE